MGLAHVVYIHVSSPLVAQRDSCCLTIALTILQVPLILGAICVCVRVGGGGEEGGGGVIKSAYVDILQ